MNNESKKQAAPGRREPDQGRETTRQAHITPEPPHIQDRAAQRARLLAMLRRGPVSTLAAAFSSCGKRAIKSTPVHRKTALACTT
jgi:hypothetical protein